MYFTHTPHIRPAKPNGLAWLAFWIASLLLVSTGRAQTVVAYIDDAWWTFQQDCNGNGCWAGTLAGDMARLNWSPDVTNCNNTLTVFEIVYSRPCGGTTYTPFYTNAPHTIVACRAVNQQYVDVPMESGCGCRDYKIEVYRSGQTTPDYVRSRTNDVDLASHSEKLLSEDICANDAFSGCIALIGPTGTEIDDNQYATKEPGEPNHAGNPGGHSLWYCWTATNNTPITFDTVGSSFDTLLAVYTGSSVSALTQVAANDDIAGATNRFSRLTFTPVKGTTYHIAVDGYGGAYGETELNWNQTGGALPDLIVWGPGAAPYIINQTFVANDCQVVEGCVAAGPRTLLKFNTETRNIGAGDMVMGDPSTNSLFVWALCHGHWHFEEFAQYTVLDSSNNVFTTGHKIGFCIEDVKAWSPTANPNGKYGNCNHTNGVDMGIQAGWEDVYDTNTQCQFIDITGAPPGDYTLQIVINPDNLIVESDYANNTTLVPFTVVPAATSCGNGPSNQDFTNAFVVGPTTPYTYIEFNSCSTGEPGIPQVADGGGAPLWFTWTPTSNHTAVVTTQGSGFDTVLGVYTGDSLGQLTVVATNDDIVSDQYRQSYVSFPATAGTTYQIMVDGWGTPPANGEVILNVDPAGNDNFTNAYVLSGRSGATNGSNIGCSKEPYEPAHAGDIGYHSVWYFWTAPENGWVDFKTAGSAFDTELAFYTNGVRIPSTGTITNFAMLSSDHADPEVQGAFGSRVDFYAMAGTTYQIAIDGFGGATGNFNLNWNMNVRLDINPLAGRDVGIDLTGVDWQRYTLLGSSDLHTWTTNTPTITMSKGMHHYTNWTVTNASPTVIYRARQEP